MEPLIVLNDISRRYTVGSEVIYALRSVSTTIYKNEYVALMGSSGSGKSTLMNILGCLDTPSGGEYTLRGIRVSEMSDNQLAEIRNKEIGFVFQTFNLLPRSTALENVALPLVYAGIGKEDRDKRALKSLQDVGLGDRVKHRPNELSGGQRQRVAVARALVNNPAIILADEPTGNLDEHTAETVYQLLRSLNRELGTSFIVVTHDLALASKLDSYQLMRDGHLERAHG